MIFENDDFVIIKTEDESVKVNVDSIGSRILVAPNGTKYMLMVDNSGGLYTIEVS